MILRSAVAAIGLAVFAFAPTATAQTKIVVDRAPAVQTGSISIDDIEQRLVGDGFQVFEIERYAHSIEVKGLDRNGQCTEMHLDPVTGAVLRREGDDDCGRDSHRGRHGRH